MFDPTSRYYSRTVKTFTRSDGTEVSYVERRFLPRDETLTTMVETRAAEGDRLDLLAGKYYGDPTQHWRLLDAQHGHVDPAELLEDEEALVRIPLPEPSR